MSSSGEQLGEAVTLYAGDCLDVLPTLAENSIDACVTDPPYGLEFMGKDWDGVQGFASSLARAGMSKPGIGERETTWPSFYGGLNPKCRSCSKSQRGGSPCQCEHPDFPNERLNRAVLFQQFSEAWAREVYRVLKPGAHLLAFGGTRTYHRMVCAIEDAGFEVRDCIQYLYATGFPKSHSVTKGAGDAICSCDNPLRGVRQVETDAVCLAQKGRTSNVFAGMQRDTARQGMGQARTQRACSTNTGKLQQRSRENEGCEEPSVERRSDISTSARQLCEREVREVPAGTDNNGSQGWLCDGAPSRDGAVDRPPVRTDRVRTSLGSSTVEQREDESGIVAGQPQPQERGAWEDCGRCGKPIVPKGLGTALKPACELIVLARKPLSEKTVAANVLRWGTGAINVDGCRVRTDENLNGGGYNTSGNSIKDLSNATSYATKVMHREFVQPTGRWPANVIHDGSDEVVAMFPETVSGAGNKANKQPLGRESQVIATKDIGQVWESDSGTAARFFYSAKADADDRIGSNHPTVKPVDLMQYLCRLVTPPGGRVLDPFAGTGTTGEAAWREGFRAVLIEREAEYQDDIRRRMKLAMAGPVERVCESIKARGKPLDHGPLFGWVQEAAE